MSLISILGSSELVVSFMLYVLDRILPAKTHWIGGWVGPRASLGMVMRKSQPLTEIDSQTLTCNLC
jgi:hypothetical protein